MKGKKQRSKLLLPTFDGSISNVCAHRRGKHIRVSLFVEEVWQEREQRSTAYAIRFDKVIAMEASMNFFLFGGDAGGFYELFSTKEKKKLLERNFIRRREDVLMSGCYNYDKDDPNDSLNYRGFVERMSRKKRLKKYRLFLMESCSGCYLILAKKCEIQEMPALSEEKTRENKMENRKREELPSC